MSNTVNSKNQYCPPPQMHVTIPKTEVDCKVTSIPGGLLMDGCFCTIKVTKNGESIDLNKFVFDVCKELENLPAIDFTPIQNQIDELVEDNSQFKQKCDALEIRVETLENQFIQFMSDYNSLIARVVELEECVEHLDKPVT